MRSRHGGNGASLALEDAQLLGVLLSEGSDPASAFADYCRRRKPRVEWIARMARKNGSMKMPGAVGRAFRDLLMPVFLRFAERDVARLHDFRVAA